MILTNFNQPKQLIKILTVFLGVLSLLGSPILPAQVLRTGFFDNIIVTNTGFAFGASSKQQTKSSGAVEEQNPFEETVSSENDYFQMSGSESRELSPEGYYNLNTQEEIKLLDDDDNEDNVDYF